MAHKTKLIDLENVTGMYTCDVCGSIHGDRGAALGHENRVHGIPLKKRFRKTKKHPVDWSKVE